MKHYATRLIVSFLAIAGASLFDVSRLEAQPLGTYKWQLLPYCNLLTLSVTQNGGLYRLEGTDNQCGATTAAAVTGLAFQNANGTIGLGLTIVATPGAAPLAIDATISLATLSGTWRDSAGGTGTFLFTLGAALPGSPRPVGGGIGAGAVDSSQVQLRVTGTCSAGASVRSVNQDGSVLCEPAGSGDITSVIAGAGLSGGALAGDAALAVNFAGAGSASTAARSDHTHTIPRIASAVAGGFPALSDAETIASTSITVAGAQQYVLLMGQASIFTNNTVAATCTSALSCNIGIEIWDADTNTVLTPLNGSFFRIRTDSAGEALSIAVVVTAAPGVHNYRLQTEFNAVVPEVPLLNNASLVAITFQAGATGSAPLAPSDQPLLTPGVNLATPRPR
jgi:hypothetical protein